MIYSLDNLDVMPAATDLAKQGIDNADFRYGPDSLHPLAYHDGLHSFEIVQDVYVLGRDCGVRWRQLGNLVIGGGFHDYEQLLGPKDNEAASSTAAINAMKKYDGFKLSDLIVVDEMIESTTFEILDGKLEQYVESYLGGILADADVGRSIAGPPEIAWDRSTKLFKEKNPYEPLEGAAMLEFMESSLILLQKHKFHTPEAEIMFPHREENIEALQAKIRAA